MDRFWHKNGDIWLVIGLFFLLIFTTGCGSTKAPVQTVAVTVGKSVAQNMPIQVSAVGNVQAFNSVVLMPQVTGKVVGIHFQQGQDVQAGNLMITIDPAPYEQKLEQAEAQLAHDSDQAKYNKASAGRYAELFKMGVVARQDYEQISTASTTQEATVWQSQAAMKGALIDLDNCYIRAPIDGRTGIFLANLGAMATANLTQLVVINQIEPIFVKFTVPENKLPAIIAAQKIAPLQVTASIADQGLNVTDGVLTFTDNTVDLSSGVVQMVAQFPNSSRQLWPGQFVRVIITLGQQPNAIVVPSEAVMDGQNGTYVYVVKADMTVDAVPVVQDRVVGNVAVITKGLTVGETVVLDGQVDLGPGTKVTVKEAAAQPPAAGDNTQPTTQGGVGK